MSDTYEVAPVEPGTVYPVRPSDPSRIGFPAMLPIELALRTGSVREICDAYNLTREDFAALVQDPAFAKAYQTAVEDVQKDGVSFRMKARMQAEELLAKSWAIIHASETPSTVKADLIKSTVRWAGYEVKTGEALAGNAFQININL
jgi:hypothetical protein